MKKLILISLGISLFACNQGTEKKAAGTPKNADVLSSNLKGKVRQTDETTTTFDSTGTAKSDSTVAVTVFDSTGYQTESYSTNPAGKKVSEQLLKRNADGSIAELRSMKDGKQVYRVVIETKDGKYTGGKNYDSTDKQDSYYTDLVTNEYGLVNAGIQHFMDGRVKATFSSKYKGPLYVGGSDIDSTGKSDYAGTVILNDNGNPIADTTFTLTKGISKTEINSYKYELDEKSNWTMRTTVNDKGKTTAITKRKITYF